MLKIVYSICCGMDVHKSFVVACIASTNEQGVTTYKSKRFSTFTGDLHGMQPGWPKTTARMCAWNPPEILDSHLQHSGTNLQYYPLTQICESHTGKKTDKGTPSRSPTSSARSRRW
jgi:hypothetical protein